MSCVQNATLKLKAAFVPSFQKVERGVWTDNSARTVRDFQCVSQHGLMFCSHESPVFPNLNIERIIIIRTLSTKSCIYSLQYLSTETEQKTCFGSRVCRIFHKEIISCTSSFTYQLNNNWTKHSNLCALIVPHILLFYSRKLALNTRCELYLNDAGTFSWF